MRKVSGDDTAETLPHIARRLSPTTRRFRMSFRVAVPAAVSAAAAAVIIIVVIA